MEFARVFSCPRRGWLALAPMVLLVTADLAAAQQLRGPPISLRPSTFQTFPPPGPGQQPFGPGNQVGSRYTAALMPGAGNIPLLNNGSLQVSQNPAPAGTPNVVPFTYIAALPIGDRLGLNGVFYDPDLLTNIGFTPAAHNLPGYPGPIAPYPYQAIAGNMFARQRSMGYGMYSAGYTSMGYGMYGGGYGGGYMQMAAAAAPMAFWPQQQFVGTMYGTGNNAVFIDPNQINGGFAGFPNQANDK